MSYPCFLQGLILHMCFYSCLFLDSCLFFSGGNMEIFTVLAAALVAAFIVFVFTRG